MWDRDSNHILQDVPTSRSCFVTCVNERVVLRSHSHHASLTRQGNRTGEPGAILRIRYCASVLETSIDISYKRTTRNDLNAT